MPSPLHRGTPPPWACRCQPGPLRPSQACHPWWSTAAAQNSNRSARGAFDLRPRRDLRAEKKLGCQSRHHRVPEADAPACLCWRASSAAQQLACVAALMARTGPNRARTATGGALCHAPGRSAQLAPPYPPLCQSLAARPPLNRTARRAIFGATASPTKRNLPVLQEEDPAAAGRRRALPDDLSRRRRGRRRVGVAAVALPFTVPPEPLQGERRGGSSYNGII
jgi:hypothetical protein